MMFAKSSYVQSYTLHDYISHYLHIYVNTVKDLAGNPAGDITEKMLLKIPQITITITSFHFPTSM